MRAETSLERAVFNHRDWRLELQRDCQRLRSSPPTGDVGAEDAIALAQALELAEPNRVHAVEMYLLGWKAAHRHPNALGRAYELCLELGQLPTAAKIARILFLKTKQPRFAAQEGMAWLDAGEPDKAVRALVAATRADPGNEHAALALATARREWPDVRAEIAGLRGRAEATAGNAAAELLLQGARIARMLGPGEADEVGRLLAEAMVAAPTNESAFSLLEAWLGERGERDALMMIYVRRAEAAPSQALELMRRAGTKWVLGKSQVGLGVQLLTRCLEHGYAGSEPIPGHLATVALLKRFAGLAGAEAELLNLIGRGLMRDHSVVESVALSAVGLDIAWGRMRNARLAHPLALVLGEVARHHPSLLHYANDGGMAKGQALSHGSTPEVVFLDQLPSPATEPSGLLDIGELEGELEGEPGSEPPAALVAEDTILEIDDGYLEIDDGDLELIVETDEMAEPDAAAPVMSAPVESGVESGIPTAVLSDYDYPPLPLPTIVFREPEQNRRDTQRLRVPADVTIRAGERAIKTVTRDIGEGGVFVLTDESFEISSQLALTVALPARDSWSVDEFELVGKIVREETAGYAIDLTDPPASYVDRVRELTG